MVAEKNMSDHTGTILIEDAHTANGFQTFTVDGASELKAGYVCTMHDHAEGTIGKIDAASEPALGVVLDSADVDINAYFADGAKVTVAMRGSSHVVWVYHYDHDGAIWPGYVVIGHPSNNGYVTNSEGEYSHIGVVIEYKPVTDGLYTPIKIRLD